MSDNPITAQWPEISEAYLTSPTTYGLIRKLSEDFSVDYEALKQRIWKAGLKEEREKLKNNLPVNRRMREKLKEAITDIAVAPAKSIAKKVEEAMDEHAEFAIRATRNLRRSYELAQEANPMDFSNHLTRLDQIDTVTRKVFGMKESEDVDPLKRGIAFLISGYEPKPIKEAEARVVG